MLNLLAAIGAAFIFRGALFITGRTVPSTVIDRLSHDKEKLKGWCLGTGIVHILWGACAICIWAAQRYTRWNFQFLCNAVIMAVTSIIVSYITTRRFSNKNEEDTDRNDR